MFINLRCLSVNLTGLQANTVYHYHLTATNAGGTTAGNDLTFVTASPASDFTYTSDGSAITITGCTGPGGEVVIPGMIEGLPVTRIGKFGFHNRGDLTRVTLPAGVTVIDKFAFAGCVNLTAITLPIGLTEIGDFAFYDCGNLANLILPSSVTGIGSYAFSDCGNLPRVTLNDGLIQIADGAFYSCDKLSHVTIPGSVTRIGESAFEACTSLVKAFFMGNAPAMESLVFESTAIGFSVYHFDVAAGFSSPTWLGYPTLSMGAVTPVAPWLIEHALPTDANLLDDANGDGVGLLMAYALDLDPQRNLSASVPQPLIDATGMSLTFHAGAAGVTYGVESSDDLQTWIAAEVTLSAPDADGCRTATVPLGSPSRYLRLVVRFP